MTKLLTVLLALATLSAPAAADRVIDLEDALYRSAMHLSDEQITANVAAALAAEGTIGKRPIAVSAELLLAMAWVESRYDRSAVSRPRGPRGPMFCGVLQAHVRTARACSEVAADIGAAYHGALQHLAAWERFCRVDKIARKHKDRLGCALAGYNGGVAAARELRQLYPRAVRRRATRLRAGWRTAGT